MSDSKQAKLIGVFGGTFDPVHCGHVAIIEAALAQMPFEHIRVIPCKIPLLKPEAQATTQQRLAMLNLAFCKNNKIIIDECELKRDTASYTKLTLQDLAQRFTDCQLMLIIGEDSFISLPKWYQWQQLFDYADCLVINRPGKFSPTPDALKAYDKQIHHLAIPPIDIASSQIRHTLCEKSLLPSVYDYIKRHGLYGFGET